VGLRPVDLQALVKQPRNVATMESTIKRLEAGDLRLRVRTLEVERMLERSEYRQKLYGAGLGACLLYQIGATTTGGGAARLARQLAYLLALRLGWEARRAWLGLSQLEVQAARFSNDGSERYDNQDFLVSELGQDAETMGNEGAKK
jgi:hypothetical protein